MVKRSQETQYIVKEKTWNNKMNGLYPLFICCCDRQLCSGEMATNDGERLGTTGRQVHSQGRPLALLCCWRVWRLSLQPVRVNYYNMDAFIIFYDTLWDY